ncbi:MATE family efflux transporter [uncultured Treponema sp.]|uniref:MATE family efflux transporter n=1 Tax=uncultured Treponema sp. TaxID=162155 RepID=UPI0025CBB448|nr:MATE family efflux transporter [uncultured Treponema sp.]
MSENIKENKMGVMPVTKLLLNMSLPIMLSMLVMACYNIVDSIFVAQINENALTAISLAFPVQTLMIAVSIGTAIGVNALLAMKLGQKDSDAVNKIAMNGLFLSVCSFIVFFILGFLFTKPYLKTQTSDEQIIQFGSEYLKIITMASSALFVSTMSDRLLQATGRTFYTMITQLVGAITNIILDPLMIFGIGPFPKMGMAGAAWATVIGQIFSAVVSLYFNLKKNPDIHFKLKGFKPNSLIIGQIYKIGIPSILLQSINSVTTYGMNLILGTFSATAIAVYGVYFKLNSFIFMPVFGLTTGMVPIVSYNYGAGNAERIKKTVKSTILIAVSIMIFGIVIFELFPAELLMLFKASEHMLGIGCTAMRIIAPSFIGAAIAITFGSTFQALGKSFLSMTVSFVRQIIVLLPVAYFLSRTGKLENVWLCFLVDEIFAISLSAFFMHRIKKTMLDKL